ncbi:cytochrome P450 [Gymnopilus junonius]|uniref:Cytochrome P450 n=1 Tax=Gymnopilus junonius TaxID=109634 RepID=A0A9P5NK51_GYMJU|nr:cytochrome P450 [Gymnopilus junonius]
MALLTTQFRQTLSADTGYGLAIVSLIVVVIFLIFKSHKTRKRLPPGPPGLPFLGNINHFSGEHFRTFCNLQKKYGPLMLLTALGQPILILGTHKIASDLLDKRAKLYSDRPTFIVAEEILTGGMFMIVARAKDRWRRMRKAAAEGLSRGVARQLQPIQIHQTAILLQALIEDSSNWNDMIKESTAILVFVLTYGQSAKKADGLAVLPSINQFVDRLVKAAMPGQYLADLVPGMKYLPSWMARWKRDAELHYRQDTAMFGKLYRGVEKLIAEGDTQNSFAATLIQHPQSNLSKDEASWLSGTMYAAGTETTSSTLSWFIFAMLSNPQVQAQAHRELDAIVGQDRLPTFADQDQLIYIQAIIRETLRWNTVSPLGSAHRLLEDDVYEGYFIPKDTIVLANVWEMNRDQSVYGPDADKFNPSRHIDENGTLREFSFTKGEGHATWGFGNRVCVGRIVAKDSLFITITFMLWACQIEAPSCMDGKPFIPSEDSAVNTGLIWKPPSFDCNFKPRFPEAIAMVREAGFS